MVEAGAQMVQEEEVLEALFFAQEQLKPILELLTSMRQEIGRAKPEVPEPPDNSDLRRKSRNWAGTKSWWPWPSRKKRPGTSPWTR